MRVAVTYENGQIFQHFGHTAEFKVYDVQDGKVIHSEVVDTNGSKCRIFCISKRNMKRIFFPHI